MTRNIVIALVTIVSVSLIAFALWSVTPSKPSSYEWQGEVLGDVQKLTITEINSLDSACESCRSTHKTLMEGVLAIGNKVDYRFRISPKPTSFSPEDPLITTSFSSDDVIGYCLSPQVGLVSQATFNKFLKLSFENNSAFALENILLFPKDRAQIDNCVLAASDKDHSLLGRYVSSTKYTSSFPAPLILLEAPGIEPVIVESTIENIIAVLNTLKNDPEGVINDISNQSE